MLFTNTARTHRNLPASLLVLSLSATVTSAQVLSVVKDFTGETVSQSPDQFAVDEAGAWVFAVTSSNQYGTNPDLLSQIFRWNPTTGIGEQVTDFSASVESVSVSDDGQWIAFRSKGNLTGANHDESLELFVMRADGSGLSQITDDSSRTGYGVLTAVIAGSGNRIVFTSDTDPLGTNPQRAPRFFVVDRDGTDLLQLADAPNPWQPAAISDDGSRAAFVQFDAVSGVTHIMTSPADASSPPTEVATRPYEVYTIALSGNGGTIVFADIGVTSKVNWDGTGLIATLASGRSPSITDDGQSVFYESSGSIRKIVSNGSGDTLVAPATSSLVNRVPVVSGDGSRLTVIGVGGQVAGGDNPDHGSELVTMDANGGNVKQLTAMSIGPVLADDTRMLANGTRVFFSSSADPVGGNSDRNHEIFTLLPNGAGLAQLTHTTGYGVREYSVSDSGVVAFSSDADLTGHNACGTIQIYRVSLSGAGLAQVTDACHGTTGIWRARNPEIRADGSAIIFRGNASVGSNTDGFPELFKIASDGTGLAPITDENEPDWTSRFSIGSAFLPNAWIAYESASNPDGRNPNNVEQIARVRITGSDYLRITADPAYSSYWPSISGDGNRIVFGSEADFVGSNPDHDEQLFLYDVPTGTMRQLTFGSLGGPGLPTITRDGAWVYWWNTLNGVFRMSLATSEVQRVSGIARSPYFLAADSTGARTLIGGENVIGPHTLGVTLLLADQNVKPTFLVGKAAPTLLAWDPDPQSARYDVIRGDLANLAIGSGEVSLGAVTCLEDDSPDNQTLGNEDADQPLPGHGFFYLYRGTIGDRASVGSWGLGAGGLERVASAGTCAP